VALAVGVGVEVTPLRRRLRKKTGPCANGWVVIYAVTTGVRSEAAPLSEDKIGSRIGGQRRVLLEYPETARPTLRIANDTLSRIYPAFRLQNVGKNILFFRWLKGGGL
jgi:hypothetical protein